ncbi:hypothetical protein PINS_up009554 [Pythium insidiosum]|nr:hypothetical protein PINS_up009554 [Pythium insidiosum]
MVSTIGESGDARDDPTQSSTEELTFAKFVATEELSIQSTATTTAAAQDNHASECDASPEDQDAESDKRQEDDESGGDVNSDGEDEEEDSDDNADAELDAPMEPGTADLEIEQHCVGDSGSEVPTASTILQDASRAVLFRRYSRLVPEDVEGVDRLIQTASCVSVDVPSCPQTLHACSSESCRELLRWKDARIQELQAALDHLAEVMAIQQRDMAAQRVFLSRQAEQLTTLSISLHQQKVSLHAERERLQRSSVKALATQLKEPVKKAMTAAGGRRTTIAAAERVSSAAAKLYATTLRSPSKATTSRGASMSQMRVNPLFHSDASPQGPLAERSASSPAIEQSASPRKTVVALTPPKAETPVSPRGLRGTLRKLPSFSSQKASAGNNDDLKDVDLEDAYSPTTTASSSFAELEPQRRREEPLESAASSVASAASITSEQMKKASGISIGERWKSLRWGRGGA